MKILIKYLVLSFFIVFMHNIEAQSVYNGSSKHIFTTNYGVIEMGPFNEFFAHIYTDRPKVVFNKPIYTLGNAFSSYNDDLKLQTNGNSRMVIDYNSGNVGIGTLTPSYKLHVISGSQIRKTTIGVTSASNENSWIRDEWLTGNYGPAKWNQTTAKWTRGSGTYNDIGGIVYQDEGTYFLREKAGAKLEFTNSEFLNTAYMFANMFNGNVGIGTNIPDSKLTVAGNIHAREVKVTIAAGADFVFNKDYKLPKLYDVEKFIKENKHLPEIASAKEMQNNGLLLAEMNIKLLQKIEELTLYTIQQEKQLEVQENQLINQSEINKNLENRLLKLELNNKN